jgi:hypothetical protein
MVMAAHVGRTVTGPAIAPAHGRIRIPAPKPRTIALLAAVALVALVATVPGEVAAAAHATCTIGMPEQATCGDALVLLGYP